MEIVFDTHNHARQVYVNRRKLGFCAYCGTYDTMTKDHVVPLCRGGSTTPRNVAFVCRSCNASKGSMSLREWLHTLPLTSPILRHATRFCAFRFPTFRPPVAVGLSVTIDNDLCDA